MCARKEMSHINNIVDDVNLRDVYGKKRRQ